MSHWHRFNGWGRGGADNVIARINLVAIGVNNLEHQLCLAKKMFVKSSGSDDALEP